MGVYMALCIWECPLYLFHRSLVVSFSLSPFLLSSDIKPNTRRFQRRYIIEPTAQAYQPGQKTKNTHAPIVFLGAVRLLANHIYTSLTRYKCKTNKVKPLATAVKHGIPA